MSVVVSVLILMSMFVRMRHYCSFFGFLFCSASSGETLWPKLCEVRVAGSGNGRVSIIARLGSVNKE